LQKTTDYHVSKTVLAPEDHYAETRGTQRYDDANGHDAPVVIVDIYA